MRVDSKELRQEEVLHPMFSPVVKHPLVTCTLIIRNME